MDDTLKALEMGAVETLICWENLDVQRYTLKNNATGETKILHLSSDQEKDVTHFTDKETGVELELEDQMPLLEWLANNYKNYGTTLEIITDKSQEGSQYVRGFGGIGGMLRYASSAFSYNFSLMKHRFPFVLQIQSRLPVLAMRRFR